MGFVNVLMQNNVSISVLTAIIIGGLTVVVGFTVLTALKLRQQNMQRRTLLEKIQENQKVLAEQLELLSTERVPQEELLRKPDKSFSQLYRRRLSEDQEMRITKGLMGKKAMELKEVYIPVKVVRDKKTSLTSQKAIAQSRCCVFIGEPGSGKTTLLKMLFAQTLDKELQGKFDVPIFVELDHFARELMENNIEVDPQNSREADTLLEYIARKQAKTYHLKKADIRSHLKAILQAGHALVLLDGLDETLVGETEADADKSYETIARIIGQLAEKYPASTFAVTCRQAVYEIWGSIDQFSQSRLFSQYGIEHLSENQIQEFLTRRWPKEGFTRNIEDFISELNIKKDVLTDDSSKGDLQGLASNPLFLEGMADLYLRGDFIADFPHNKASVLERIADMLFIKWDTAGGKDHYKRISNEGQKAFLAEIGWHYKPSRPFSGEQVLKDIAAYVLPDNTFTKEDIEKLLAESGFLRKDDGGLWFTHNIWQTYFAAWAVANETEKLQRYGDKLEVLLQEKDNPVWKETIKLFCAYTERIDILLDRLLGNLPDRKPLQEDLFTPNIVLVGDYSIDSITHESRLNSVRDQVFQKVLPEALQKTPYKSTRKGIVKNIAKYASLDRTYSPFRAIDIKKIENIQKPKVAVQVIQMLYEEAKKNGVKEISADLYYLVTNNENLNEEVQRQILQLLREYENLPVIFDLLTVDLLTNLPPRRLIVDVFGTFEYGEALLREEDKPRLYNTLLTILEWDKNKNIPADLGGKIVRMLGRIREDGLPSHLVNCLSRRGLGTQVRRSIPVALGLQRRTKPTVLQGLERFVGTEQDVNLRIYGELALLALGKDEIRNTFSWLPCFSQESKYTLLIKLDILNTVVELRLQQLIPYLFTLVGESQQEMAVRVQAIIAIIALAKETEDALPVYCQLLDCLTGGRMIQKQEEELCLAILAHLIEWQATDRQKEEVYRSLESLPWQKEQVSTKNIWAALTLARYVYGNTVLLPELIPLTIDKDIYGTLRCHLLLQLTKHSNYIIDNPEARDMYNQTFANYLFRWLLDNQENNQKMHGYAVGEPFAWYDDLLPDTYEDTCIAALLISIEPILSSKLQTSILNTLRHKLLKEFQINEDTLRRYRCMSDMLSQFVLRKREQVIDVIIGLVKRLNDLEKSMRQDMNRDAGEIEKNKDEREVAGILFQTLYTIQNTMGVGKPSLYRDKPDGEIRVGQKGYSDQRKQTPEEPQQQEQTSLTL